MKKMLKMALAASVLALVTGGFLSAQALEFYYYKQESTPGMEKLVAEFTKDNPSIKINLLIVPNDAGATLKTRAASGKLPDLMQLQGYSQVFEYAKPGYLVDLTKDETYAKILDDAKAAVTYKGKGYALPMDFAGIGIIYNKALFKKFNLTPPTTFVELQKVASELKKNKITPFAGLLKENWSIGHFITLVHTTLIGAKGGNAAILKFIDDMNAGTTSFGKAADIGEITKIIDFYKANMDSNAAEMSWNEQQAAFAGEKAAMMVQGLWSYGAAIATNPKLDCGFIPFPVTANAKDSKFYADTDSTIAISSQSTADKQTAAKKFLAWLSTPKAIKLWTTEVKLTSTFKGADVSGMQTPFQELVQSVNKIGAYPWAFSMYPVAAFENGAKESAQGYALGKKTKEDIVKDIDAIWAANKPK